MATVISSFAALSVSLLLIISTLAAPAENRLSEDTSSDSATVIIRPPPPAQAAAAAAAVVIPGSRSQIRRPTMPSLFNNVGSNKLESQLGNAALRLLRVTDCSSILLGSSRGECEQVKKMPVGQFALHLAPPNKLARYKMILPDWHRSTARLGTVASVIVLDPFSTSAFGHLVLIFWADMDATEALCQLHGGVRITDTAGCLWWALKQRCRNSFGSRSAVANRRRHCQTLFLPLVHLATDRRRAPDQRLQCHADAWPGFAPCPQRRTIKRRALCDPGQTNTQLPEAGTHNSSVPSLQRCEALTDVNSRCAITARCDHALLLAGGWSDDIPLPQAERALHRMHDRLTALGLSKTNIQVFFGDGRTELKKLNPGNVHAAGGMKVAFRQHLQRLCATPYCVGTLVIYLHNPTKHNGDMLLWDMEGNGKISADEQYSGEELHKDLIRCRARRVHILADQNYAGALGVHLTGLPNVAVYAAVGETEYSHGAAFTDALLERDLSRECISSAVQAAGHTVAANTNRTAKGSVNISEGIHLRPATLFGRPCDSRLRRPLPAGCRSLPTRIIMQRMAAQRRLRLRHLGTVR